MNQHADVIVIGGGPAGSTAAALLAAKGRKVLVLEKASFPRYHIGESLMPYTWFVFQRLGVLEKIKAAGYQKKHSVQFVSMDGKVSTPFYFFKHLEHEAAQTWQVPRAEFDLLLLDNAREKGAEVREGVTVKELIVENGRVLGVDAVDAAGTRQRLLAPVTIDCSGRETLSMRQFKWGVPDKHLDRFALWTYYRGAKRDPGLDEGATTVGYLPNKGWFWYIPMGDDVVSVGIVARKDYLFRDTQDPAAIMAREIQANAWISDHIASGTQFGKYFVTNEYSYRSRHCASDGLVLAGDAHGFLDPVFSSGVFLALRSGELAADAVDQALARGDTSAASFVEYGEKFHVGIEAMRQLVYAFYDEKFSFGRFIRTYPQLAPNITDCLIGNLHIDFAPFFAALAEFADLPKPMPHGTVGPVHAGGMAAGAAAHVSEPRAL